MNNESGKKQVWHFVGDHSRREFVLDIVDDHFGRMWTWIYSIKENPLIRGEMHKQCQRVGVTCWRKLRVGVDNCDGSLIPPLSPLLATPLLSAVLFCWKAYKRVNFEETVRQKIMPPTNCILLWGQIWVWLPTLLQVRKGLRNFCLGGKFVLCLWIEYLWLDLTQRWKLTWTSQLDCEVWIRKRDWEWSKLKDESWPGQASLTVRYE